MDAQVNKEQDKTKKRKFTINAYFILVCILILLTIITAFMAASGVAGITSPSLGDMNTAPILGFIDAISVCLFVMVLGGFLGIVTKTGALDAGIASLVHKLRGNELVLIPIIMTLFSIGGTTFGMCEETVPFYLLLAATMVAAGFDSLTGAAMVLLGAGCGVIGSTVNPFAVGTAIDALNSVGVQSNQGFIIIAGIVLWFVTLGLSILVVMRYAKRVKADPTRTLLSATEQENMMKTWGMSESEGEGKTNDTLTLPKLTRTQVWVLILFGITFAIMILGFVPWNDFGISIFDGWSSILMGVPIGKWYFNEATAWFLLMSIVIALVARFSQADFLREFFAGASDMMSVIFVIALARSITILMGETGLDIWLLTHAAEGLQGLSAAVFAPVSFIAYIGLSFLIPSSSGMATVSMPIMGALAAHLGFSADALVSIFSAGNGLVNLFSPTSAAIMGGLALAKVNYVTWLKFSWKLIVALTVVCGVILTIAMMILPASTFV